ncbi:hypothetical protein EYF80_037239 [Liparis tanakae]|uniref:Uncharacterized protein n=1 Tax=Liparis tanakae TaxID=230148 RepID=A0A4Z2GIK5_9TELE|nr:hypothetical protein EYF80_037239 [Liparis tanakae]
MEIPGTVTPSVDAVSCSWFNPCSPAGELDRDQADYRRLPPQQTAPSNANSRGGRSSGYGGVRYDGATDEPSGSVDSINKE